MTNETVLRAKTGADFLAMVPTLAGYVARNSVVVVMFRGKRTAGAFRYDLPTRRRTADYRRVAAAAIALASRMPGVDHVAPVIYSEATFAAERGIPWLELMRTLRQRFRDAGFGIRDELCVAPDGWGSYLDPHCPREGRPLAEIEASELTEQARKVRGEELTDLATKAHLPHKRPLFARALAAALDALYAGDDAADDLLDTIEALGDPGAVPWLELCLERADDIPVPAAAWLALLVQSPAIRDQVTLQIAFGREAGEETAAVNAEYARRQRETGFTMDELVRRDMEAGRQDRFGDVFIGETAKRPDVRRVDAGIELFRQLAANLPRELLPAPLCVLAWLNWSLGLSSVGARHVDAALEIDPEYGMARVLWSLLASGKIPEWAFNDGYEPE